MALGGEVSEILINPPILSLGCAAASYPTFTGTRYRLTFTAPGVGIWWLRWFGLSSGTVYHMNYTGLGGGGQPTITAGRRGNTCASVVSVTLTAGTNCVSWTAGSSLHHWILITTPGAGTFTFEVELGTGTC